MDTLSPQVKRHENRTIVLPFEQDTYGPTSLDAVLYRQEVERHRAAYPELFPDAIAQGYRMKDCYHSLRLGLLIRRIEIGGIAYTVRPSFVLPYLSGWTKDAEPALFMRKFDAPFWALEHLYGKSAMHFFRLEQSLGRYSLVETTVRTQQDLPAHVVADEKYSWLKGEKVFIPTTAAGGCILGASVVREASEAALTQGYGVFKQEAQAMRPDYQPKTVTTDGWAATRLAWRALFPSISLILCFLHIYISLRDRAKLKFASTFRIVADKLWHCYQAKTQSGFSQRLRHLCEWAKDNTQLPEFMREKLAKVYQQAEAFRIAYRFPLAHRTSNLIDRLMQRMDRHLFSTQYFHGDLRSAELSIRGWALIHNFAPFNPYTVKRHAGWRSPAEAMNQFRYHDNWLQNLLISTSLVGKYRPPQNAL